MQHLTTCAHKYLWKSKFHHLQIIEWHVKHVASHFYNRAWRGGLVVWWTVSLQFDFSVCGVWISVPAELSLNGGVSSACDVFLQNYSFHQGVCRCVCIKNIMILSHIYSLYIYNNMSVNQRCPHCWPGEDVTVDMHHNCLIYFTFSGSWIGEIIITNVQGGSLAGACCRWDNQREVCLLALKQ